MTEYKLTIGGVDYQDTTPTITGVDESTQADLDGYYTVVYDFSTPLRPRFDPMTDAEVAAMIAGMAEKIDHDFLYGGPRVRTRPASDLTLKRCDRCRAYVSHADHPCVPELKP